MKMFKILCAMILILSFASTGFSEEVKRTAIVTGVRGEVMAKDPGPGSWLPARVGRVLNEGSFVKTGAGSIVILGVDDSKTAVIDVSEKSIVSFDSLTKDSATGMKKTLLGLPVGQILIKAQRLDTPDSKFEVKTPTSVVGVRGTKFSVKVDAAK